MQNNSSPAFNWSFLSLKYWPTWLAFGLLWIIHLLPRKWIMAIGAWVGKQMYQRNQKRRNIASINLQWCFPDKSEEERQQLLLRHYQVFGAVLVDLGTIWWGSEKRLRKLIKCPDEEKYRQLTAQNNTIFFTPHVAALDAGGVVISRNGKGISMMKRDKNEVFTWKMYRSRSRFNDAIIMMRDQGLKSLLKSIREGRACYYMPDEDFGDAKFTEFAPFFGIETSTISMLSRLAKLTKAECVPCMTALDLDTGIYTFHIGDPLLDHPSDDVMADVTAMNKALEAVIRISPEQYIWTFKWFKTRPNGEEPPY